MMNTTITSGPTMDFTPETLEILADALKCGIINKEDVLKEVKMKQNEKIINQHPYKINQGKMDGGTPTLRILNLQRDVDRLPNPPKKKFMRLFSQITINEIKRMI